VPAAAAVEIWHGPTTRRAVALTFDAGSDAGYAAEVLDILTAEHVTASFGVTGVWAEAHPALVRRMGQVGQILNHTYDHRSFTGCSTGAAPLGPTERRSELDRAEAAIQSTGAPAAKPWFRPPYGDRDAGVLADVGAAGYRYAVMWSLDSLGWKGLSADGIVARCLDRSAAQPGAIYLFHVGSQSADHAALRRIIEGLRTDGYSFETVAGLVGG
jgi:peptidoglycan/xylan/chitin deacetylase (PgdA/CDA1 family)